MAHDGVMPETLVILVAEQPDTVRWPRSGTWKLFGRSRLAERPSILVLAAPDCLAESPRARPPVPRRRTPRGPFKQGLVRVSLRVGDSAPNKALRGYQDPCFRIIDDLAYPTLSMPMTRPTFMIVGSFAVSGSGAAWFRIEHVTVEGGQPGALDPAARVSRDLGERRGGDGRDTLTWIRCGPHVAGNHDDRSPLPPHSRRDGMVGGQLTFAGLDPGLRWF